jgi:hypothetical protein
MPGRAQTHGENCWRSLSPEKKFNSRFVVATILRKEPFGDNVMGILRSLFGRKKPPPNPIRETLFGDMPLDRWPPGALDSFPWTAFAAARSHLAEGRSADAIAAWREVLAHPGLGSRHYLQAWHFLRQYGQPPPPEAAKQVLGVVVEVGMPQGLDILAAYADHSARYYNFSGAAAVWLRPDGSLDPLIDQLLAVGAEVAARIGPWKQARPPAPGAGGVRLSFLTPSGLHFGQGPMDRFQHDPLAGVVLRAAMPLLRALTALGR